MGKQVDLDEVLEFLRARQNFAAVKGLERQFGAQAVQEPEPEPEEEDLEEYEDFEDEDEE